MCCLVGVRLEQRQAVPWRVASEVDLVDEILSVGAQLLQDTLPDLAVDVGVEKHGLVACATSSR